MKYTGLTDSQVKESAQKYGINRLEKQKTPSFLVRLIGNLGDPIIRILLIALGVNMIFMLGSFDWFETFGIIVAITIATLVTTLSEYSSEKAFERLEEQAAETKVRLIRNGDIAKHPIEEIVVGDLVVLSMGEMVPADGILVDGALTVDQSVLNGESKEANKYPLPGNRGVKDPNSASCLLRGVSVTAGEGIMLVEAVGNQTLYGELAKELQSEKRESPLKLRLTRLAEVISKIGYIAAAVVAVCYYIHALIIESGWEPMLIVAKFTNWRWQSNCLIHCLTLAITLIVVAVPEGLPMMITVVLSSNMRKMLKDGILVRKLVGIETAGSLNILFTDKTGTLTTGKQTVISFVDGSGTMHELSRMIKCRLGDQLREVALHTGQWQIADQQFSAANSADRAFAKAFAITERSSASIRRRIPFDSVLKYSAAETVDGQIWVKGAPEKLFDYCTSAIDANGKKISFQRSAVENAARRLADQGCRLIGMALGKRYPNGNDLGELIFLGIAVIRDPVRHDAKNALHSLQQAGIQVVMMTGDSVNTARAIATECGLLKKGRDLVLSGSDLSALGDREIAELLPNLAVIARALPSDKSRLVRIAQSCNRVAGMTGDGVNDAPALKIADVGFAMGSGTEIAKEAGDIVLFGDSIGYIAKAVLFGRTIFTSIRKFILFQLTMNFSAVGISLIGPFIGIDTPVTVVQMLWINIIMDTLGALAFAGEPPTLELMREKPKRRDEPLLSSEMAVEIAFSGSLTLVICILFLRLPIVRTFYSFEQSPLLFLSAFFGLFIFLGVANCFIARTPRINLLAHLKENKAFIGIMIVVSMIQLCMIYFGGSLFRATPLSASELLLILCIAGTIIPLELGRRLWTKLTPRLSDH